MNNLEKFKHKLYKHDYILNHCDKQWITLEMKLINLINENNQSKQQIISLQKELIDIHNKITIIQTLTNKSLNSNNEAIKTLEKWLNYKQKELNKISLRVYQNQFKMNEIHTILETMNQFINRRKKTVFNEHISVTVSNYPNNRPNNRPNNSTLNNGTLNNKLICDSAYHTNSISNNGTKSFLYLIEEDDYTDPI